MNILFYLICFAFAFLFYSFIVLNRLYKKQHTVFSTLAELVHRSNGVDKLRVRFSADASLLYKYSNQVMQLAGGQVAYDPNKACYLFEIVESDSEHNIVYFLIDYTIFSEPNILASTKDGRTFDVFVGSTFEPSVKLQITMD